MTYIYLIIALILLGIVQNGIKLSCIKKNWKFVSDFFDQLKQFCDDCQRNEQNNELLMLILSKGEKCSDILQEDPFNMPILKIVKGLTYNNISIEEIEKYGQRANCNFVCKLRTMEEQYNKIRRQFLNPFVLFYEGVELVMMIVFGYLLEKVIPNFNREQKWWQVFVTIVSVLGGFASIYGCLK